MTSRTAVRLAATAVLCATLACGSSSTEPDPDGPPYMSASLNGQKWQVTFEPRVVAFLFANGNLLVESSIEPLPLEGPDALRVAVTITGEGRYALPAAEDTTAYGGGSFRGRLSSEPGPQVEYLTRSANDGYLTITHLDSTTHTIAGKFFFTAESSEGQVLQVSKGEFRTRYSDMP